MRGCEARLGETRHPTLVKQASRDSSLWRVPEGWWRGREKGHAPAGRFVLPAGAWGFTPQCPATGSTPSTRRGIGTTSSACPAAGGIDRR